MKTLSPLVNLIRRRKMQIMRQNLKVATKMVDELELADGFMYQEGSHFVYGKYRVLEKHETETGWSFLVVDPDSENNARIKLRLEMGNRHTRRRNQRR